MRHSLLPIVPLLCAPLLTAQSSAIIPSQYAATEAPGLELEPFGYNRVRSVQYVDRSLLTAVPLGAQVNRIAYRRDTNGYTAANMTRTGRPAPNPVWQVRLGNTDQAALNPSFQFPAVFQQGWTLVFTPKQVAFPATSIPGGGGPANFDIQLPFDFPFLYAGGNLGIEHYAFESNSNVYTYIVDAIDSQPGGGVVDLLTPTSYGCPAGENRAGGVAPNPGENLWLYLFGGPPQSLAFAGLGFGSTSWAGYALPLNLGLFGLPGCTGYVDILSAQLAPTSANGYAEYALPIPAAASYTGMNLLTQWLLIDDRVNPAFPLATSDALRFTLGSQVGQHAIPMSMVSAINNLANGNSGYVWPGRGAVFRLTW